MQFLNPLGLLALLGIPVVILMYLLKQKYKETKIPSLFLWKQAAAMTLSQRPWQKLKKNLLLLLQLMAIILLALGLANPFFTGGKKGENFILILDQSLSMQARDEVPNRFEAAKNQIQKFVENAPPNTGISLLVMGNMPYLAVNNTTEKNEIYRALREITVSNSGIDFENGISLMKTQQEQTNANFILFTDQSEQWNGLGAEIILFGKSAENCAITLLSHTIQEKEITALVKVQNFGVQEAVKTVTLYQDEKALDVQEVTLQPGESKDILFQGVSAQAKKLSASLSPHDILEADDIYYDTVNQKNNQKAILFTKQNIFLEKILGILPNIELYKGKIDQMENLNGYGLYIFDGILPETLPTDGYLLIFQPPEENSFIQTGENVKVSIVTQGGSKLFSPGTETNFVVGESRKLGLPNWGEIILQSPETPLVIAGEYGNQKAVVFGFDLHQSDLPLSKEFPILIYNMIAWYFPDSISGMDKVQAGNVLEFAALADSTSVQVIKPDAKRVSLAPPFPLNPFADTELTGIYILEQKNQEGIVLAENFAVNAVTEGESNLIQKEGIYEEAEQKRKIDAGRSLQSLVLILLLLLLGAEWWVSCHEH